MATPELNQDLSQVDPVIFDLIEKEKRRQYEGLELIASENFTSKAVLDCLGSVLTNKYSEGLPGARFYAGNENIDAIERLCQERALAAYSLSADTWGVNVQPLSGSPANFQLYHALLKPHDRIMGLDLPSGGHLTHGFMTAKKKVSATSVFFESMPYRVDPDTGIIDYDSLARDAEKFKPRLIVCGGSAYPRDMDYARFREIADSVGAFLLCDMAHISGLVAAGLLASPFDHCDAVTTTTHKSLRGPRSGLIFAKAHLMADVNQAVFPSLQGGPHNHQIAGVAVALALACEPGFADYQRQTVANARALAAELVARGHRLSTGGTDNHLILWDLKPHGITGSKLEKVAERAGITLNKNSVLGDTSAVVPGGVRVGAPALTSRGFVEADFVAVAGLLDRCVAVAVAAQKRAGSTMLKAFLPELDGDEELAKIAAETKELATRFPMPGFDVAQFK